MEETLSRDRSRRQRQQDRYFPEGPTTSEIRIVPNEFRLLRNVRQQRANAETNETNVTAVQRSLECGRGRVRADRTNATKCQILTDFTVNLLPLYECRVSDTMQRNRRDYLSQRNGNVEASTLVRSAFLREERRRRSDGSLSIRTMLSSGKFDKARLLLSQISQLHNDTWFYDEEAAAMCVRAMRCQMRCDTTKSLFDAIFSKHVETTNKAIVFRNIEITKRCNVDERVVATSANTVRDSIRIRYRNDEHRRNEPEPSSHLDADVVVNNYADESQRIGYDVESDNAVYASSDGIGNENYDYSSGDLVDNERRDNTVDANNDLSLNTENEASTLDRLDNLRIEQLDNIKRMHYMFVEYINKFRSIDETFFDFLIERNVVSVSGNKYVDILIHCVNYSPSVSLAHMFSDVFRGSFTFPDICSFVSKTCRVYYDDLFSRRTLFIVNRYIQLGHDATYSILGELCCDDGFLYPLCARRTIVNISDMQSRNDDCEVLRNGACSAFDDLMDKTYDHPNIHFVIYDYIRSMIVPMESSSADNGDLNFATIMRYFVKRNEHAATMFNLINVVFWRFDGTSYLDATTASVVHLSAKEKFSDKVYDFLCAAKNESASNDRRCGSNATSLPSSSSRNRNESRDAGFDDAIGFASNVRRGRNNTNNNNSNNNNNYVDSDINATESIGTIRRYRGDNTGNDGGNFRRKHASSTGHNVGETKKAISELCSGMVQRYLQLRSSTAQISRGKHIGSNVATDNSTRRGETSSKFVRYVDNVTNQRIMLNLYLNRFELTTPNVANMLTIDYRDFDPPTKYRFNEMRDDFVQDFAQACVDGIAGYFTTVCSLDVLNHYLYSRLVAKRDRNDRRCNREASRTNNRHGDDYDFAFASSSPPSSTTSNRSRYDALYCDDDTTALDSAMNKIHSDQRAIERLVTERDDDAFYKG